MALKDLFFRLTHWETWEWRIKYIPIFPVWLWYSFRSGSAWFFTASNPTLTFGGFEGEPKKEAYDQLPPDSYPKTEYISKPLSFEKAEEKVLKKGFKYPFIVKPAIGRMGLMFRRINTPEEFRQYHDRIPFNYMVQELVNYPLEVSVFYYRFPDKLSGHITGFIKKESMQVTGDGRSTLLELMIDNDRVRFRLDEMKLKHAERLNDILPAGELFYLSYASNLSRGGRLISMEHEKDERLLKVFDELSLYTKHFYYGRYDIKCASIEDLKQGKQFMILEYNGSGAEPHHAYGNGNTLTQALQIFLFHWNILYEISVHNHKSGVPYWSFRDGWKRFDEANRYFRVLKKIDSEFPAL